MSIALTCVCNRSFAVRDELAGKRVKCPGCAQPVRVPLPTDADDSLAGLKNLDLDDLKSLPSLPPLPKKRKPPVRRHAKVAGQQGHSRWPFAFTPTVIAGFSILGLFLCSVVAGLISPALMAILQLVLLLSLIVIGLAGAAVAAVGGILLLVSAFEEDVACGLMYLLVPCYALYYMISRWNETKAPKIAGAGSAMMLASIMALTVLPTVARPTTRTNSLSRWEGRPAPDLTIRTTDGATLKLSEFRGRGVILDCWATWCGPCLRELPHLQRVADDLPKDLVVVGVSSEELRTLQNFARSKSLRYPVGISERPPSPYTDVSAVPTTFFIDRRGTIRKILVGYHDYAALRAQASLIVE